MRTVKEADERKNEILDVAESLFISKGYDNTTITDLLDVMDIARGTLYYHYKSKEEVLDGILARRGAAGVEAAQAIVEDNTLSPLEKLVKFILSQRPETEQQEQLVAALESSGNSQMFQKSLIYIVLHLAPIFGKIIEQGNKTGVFNAPYPQERAEVLFAASHALFDNGEFHWTAEEKRHKITVFLSVAERILGAQEGSILQMTQLF